jgi:hypothetical protein
MAEERIKNREEALAPVIAKAWKDEKFKQEFISNPKAVINKEFGVQIPDNINVKVVEEDMKNLYIILPMKPQIEGELTDEQLEAVAGGECVVIGLLVGVAGVGIVALAGAIGIGGGAVITQTQRQGW